MDIIALLSPRLRAAKTLLNEIEDAFVGIEDLIHDKAGDPKVQRVLNDMRDIRRKFDIIRGQ